jgi:beta-galactosidase
MIFAMNLGVCYYPEHWPKEHWADDARRMKELGLSYVRIGEFAWSRLEASPGVFSWDWLDEAVAVLGNAGLGVVLGTPTATPPKWLIDQYPSILAYTAEGQPRKFGSRRHYTHSSTVYLKESARIVQEIAQRYGKNPHIVGWQTDNEYGCHDTVRSYGPEDLKAFRVWLKQKYKQIEALNAAWGNVFWSMEYGSFSEIELPNLTVTEPNPSHVLDFYRFSSDQVIAYNKMQVDILRQYSPGRFICHNFMGFYTHFDHFALAQDLDIATWDSYPQGFTDREAPISNSEKVYYAQASHPDIAAFHHDLYRGTKNRWWVMEQQPGPVNWAPNNPSPAAGVVRLWTWEALAHGAETVSYFRWRQLPFAQEQMHTGLHRPDYQPDLGYAEAQQVAQEIAQLGSAPASAGAPVALIYDYEASWLFEIQRHGTGWSYTVLCNLFYSALRELGLDVDFVPPGSSLSGYQLAVAPCLPILRPQTLAALQQATCPVVFGPRTGSKTPNFHIPSQLPPGPLQQLLPIKVTRVESYRPGLSDLLHWNQQTWEVAHWREWLESGLTPVATYADATGALYTQDRFHYFGFWPTLEFIKSYISSLIPVQPLPRDIRIRRRGDWVFAFNYAPHAQVAPAAQGAEFLLGGPEIAAYGLSIWRIP